MIGSRWAVVCQYDYKTYSYNPIRIQSKKNVHAGGIATGICTDINTNKQSDLTDRRKMRVKFKIQHKYLASMPTDHKNMTLQLNGRAQCMPADKS